MFQNQFRTSGHRVFSVFMGLSLLLGLFISPLPASALPIISSLSIEFTTCENVDGISLEECEALIALYNSAGGESWLNKTDWLQTDTPCEWYGVYCMEDEESHKYVTEIYMWGNNLVGTLPAELTNLTYLEKIWMADNQLSGIIPSGLGNLSSLHTISLSNNNLSGTLPEGLGNLTNLQYLWVNDNSLTGEIPSSLGNLNNLLVLSLGGNQLSGEIPPEIGYLDGITHLSIFSNNLTGEIPETFGNLITLEVLNLSGNSLSGEIPASITNLVNLVEFTVNCGLTSTSPDVITFLDAINPRWSCTELYVMLPGNSASVYGGAGWIEAPGKIFTMIIDDPATPDAEDYRLESETLDFVIFDYEVKPGFIITVTDGLFTRYVVVLGVIINDVNVLNSTVSGTTNSDLPLIVSANCNGTRYVRRASPIPGEEWVVDFSIPGSGLNEQTTVSLTYECNVNASQIYADGGRSGYQWPYGDGFGQTDPMNDGVSAEFWPPGTQLTLNIDDPQTVDVNPDYSVGPVEMGQPEPHNRTTGLLFDLGDYDLKPGDVITIHAGPDLDNLDLFQFTSTVDNLDITFVDLYNGIVYGTAEGTGKVTVFASQDYWLTLGIRTATVENGQWSVNFSKPVPGGSFFERVIVPLTSESRVDADIGTSTEVSWPPQKSRLVDAAGRTIFLENTEVTIPAGAIETETEFSLQETGSGFQSSATNTLAMNSTILDVAMSAIISGPEGTTFNSENAAAVKLEWPDKNNDGFVDQLLTNEADLYLSKDGVIIAGPCHSDPNCDQDANTYLVQVTSLSYFVLGSPSTNHEPSALSSTFTVKNHAPSGAYVGVISYTDLDEEQAHTCSIQSGNEGDIFSIDHATCIISVSSSSVIDHDTIPTYQLKVRVTDNGVPAKYGEATITVNVTESIIATSTASNDGWILESSETSNKGGTLNKGASTLNVGDDAANRQYRAVMSFGTAALPDDSVVTKVTLKVKRQGVTGGGNPITIFGGFMVDVKKGAFWKSALQLADFQTKGSKTLSGLKPALKSGWYTMNLTAAKAQINKTGITQIRLRFKLDDNNNLIANFLKLYSGNAAAASRPQLIIEYYTP